MGTEPVTDEVLAMRGERATLSRRACNAASSLRPGWRRHEAICILGAPRSGTSSITRVLNLLGVYLGAEGDLIPAGEDNPTGFWEHTGLVGINERVLAQIGGGPASRGDVWRDPLEPEQGWESSPELARPARRAVLMVRMHFGGATLWGWKDPRTALTLPFWQRVVPNMRYVICVRNPADAARSLLARGDADLEHGYQLWLRYTSAALAHTASAPRLVVSYEALLTQTDREIARLAAFIGRPERADAAGVRSAISAFLDPGLRHHRTAAVELDPDAPQPVRDLHAALLAEAAVGPAPAAGDRGFVRAMHRARHAPVATGRMARAPTWLRPVVAWVIEAPVGTARYRLCLSVRVARLAPSRLTHAHLLLASLLAPLRDRVPLLRGRTRTIHVCQAAGRVRLRVGPSTDFDVLNEILVLGQYDLPEIGAPRVILDLGSHIGASILRFRSNYPDASIFGLEPDPSTFSRLKANAGQLPGVSVMPWAVAGGDGQANFFPRYQSWLSSTIPPDSVAPSIAVEAVTLDTALERLGIERVDLLKLDVEGAEGSILSASRALDRVDVIIGEVHGDDRLREVLSALHDFDVECSGALDHRLIIARRRRAHGRG